MKSIVCVLVVAAAVTGSTSYAQDFDDFDEELSSEEVSSDEGSGEEASGDKESKDGSIDIGGRIHQSNSEASFFYTIPTVRKLTGVGDVLKPGVAEWEPALEGRYYPLGTVFRTTGADSKMEVRFGIECSVTILGEGSFQTRKQGLDEKARSITLKGGIIRVNLPGNLPEGKFTIEAPGFSVFNPAGISSYKYVLTGDGDEATIRCNTGSLSVKGRHFHIVSMRAANEVRIRTSQDVLFTGIYGSRGNCICNLDQGMVKITDIETGELHVKAKTLEWKISPQTAVRIHRSVPKIGKNMAVSIMTFDATGAMKNRCAFAENRFEINTGELAPKSKSVQAELVKKAEEVSSDTVVSEVEAVDADVSEEDSSDDSGDDSPSDDSSEDSDADFVF